MQVFGRICLVSCLVLALSATALWSQPPLPPVVEPPKSLPLLPTTPTPPVTTTTPTPPATNPPPKVLSAQPGASTLAPSATKATDGKAPATIQVKVPSNATIWIGGQKMTQTGVDRSFQSPPLEVGKNYYYTFKLSWPRPGQADYSTEHEVTVRGGQSHVIDFTALAGTPITQPATSQPVILPGPPPPRSIFPRRYEGSSYR